MHVVAKKIEFTNLEFKSVTKTRNKQNATYIHTIAGYNLLSIDVCNLNDFNIYIQLWMKLEIDIKEFKAEQSKIFAWGNETGGGARLTHVKRNHTCYL